MQEKSTNLGGPGSGAANAQSLPVVVGRDAFQAELDNLRVREKAHTRESDAIAAARRRLPMVEVDAKLALTGPHGPLTLLDAFEGRRQLIAYYFMWHTGHPAAEQCEGCTWVTTQIAELSYLHSRDITYGLFHLVCYLREGDRVYETYWTSRRGAEVLDYSYALMDLTMYGRQEPWEDSPSTWPQQCTYTRTSSGSPTWQPVWPGGRPIAQWSRLQAGRSDDLAVGP